MSTITIALIALLLIISGGCSGGNGFVPVSGAYPGQFMVGQEVIGTFNVTINASSATGGGTLLHNGQVVNVVVAATVSGATITGKVENASLGHGAFTGKFLDRNSARGEFNYTDTAGLSTSTGTWIANLP